MVLLLLLLLQTGVCAAHQLTSSAASFLISKCSDKKAFGPQQQ
jgi:hypothetical protein